MKGQSKRHFGYDDKTFLLDGEPFRVYSGELHYFRVPREYWRHRLRCARLMGLNTVSTYMPWNLHEPRPGRFDFDGDLDVAAFLNLAQEEGLKVILRPGPYICAEWDAGGLTSWLFADPAIKVRCLDPAYAKAVRRYMREVGKRCAKFEWAKGGPVILTQVENEYGAFGNDRSYMDWMVALVRDCGFDGQLYTCDWAKPANLKAGEVSGAITVANFGGRAAEQIGCLKALRPNQPPMCGEFWAGWFDSWGRPRNGSADPAPVLAELQWMLDNDTSFNFYMFHGGTSFGPMAGANYYDGYAPTVSSYDYWAPLDESGQPTDKYFAIRDLLNRYRSEPIRESPPEPPYPLRAFGSIAMTETANLVDNLGEPIRLPQPLPMESLGLDFGLVLYRCDIAGLGDNRLTVVEAHDFATVSLNGKVVGEIGRRPASDSLQLTGVGEEQATLDILVDAMGRINFGPRLIDRKGITDRVEYGDLTLMEWEAFPIPFTADYLGRLGWKTGPATGAAFYRGQFAVDEIADTFLDLGSWKRGVVWVNGRCLGRFWDVGPQRTLFLPGAWLRLGQNELIVFDLAPHDRPNIESVARPRYDGQETSVH